VDIERDITVSAWADLREVAAGEPCPNCGEPIAIVRCIEIGHIFKLGTLYAEKFGVTVADADGKDAPVVMGSYGIGIGRNMAAAVEANYDDNGIIWPVNIAPFECVITLMRLDDDTLAAGENLYAELRAEGVDVLLDDRDARAGVKFADAELVGIPYRITIGPKGLASGELELTERRSGDTVNVAIDALVATVVDAVKTAKA
jgi:prolyl-tRNA synthetase